MRGSAPLRAGSAIHYNILQMIVARLIKWMLVAGKEIKLGVMATKKPGKKLWPKRKGQKGIYPK
jgi:hypothetical protein